LLLSSQVMMKRKIRENRDHAEEREREKY